MVKKIFSIITVLFILFYIISNTNISKASDRGNIDYVDGKVNLINNLIYLDVKELNQKFNINDYSFYYVTNFNGEDLYAADIVSDHPNYSEIGIYEIRIILSKESYDFYIYENEFDKKVKDDFLLKLCYFDKTENELFIVYSELNKDFFDIICSDTKSIDIYDDNEISKIIFQSLSFELSYKAYIQRDLMNSNSISIDDSQIKNNQNYNNINSLDSNNLLLNETYSSTYANENQTVLLNYYDKYTNTDGIIDNYLTNYIGNVHKTDSYIYTSDDPIVNLVPKELFRNTGTYSYIGLEYGFFVETFILYGSDLCSNVLVFDIETTKLGPNTAGNVSIIPVISEAYIYKNITKTVNITANESANNLALSKVNIKVSSNNINEPNLGDLNYVDKDDLGYYFNVFHLQLKESGLSRNDTDRQVEILKMSVGYVENAVLGPIVGTFAKFASNALLDTLKVDGYTRTVEDFTINRDIDGSYRIDEFYWYPVSNSNIIIDDEGHLPKAIDVYIDSQNYTDNNVLVYKSDGSFFNLSYGVAQKDSDQCKDNTIQTQIEFDIVLDETGNLFGGDVIKLDHVKGGYIERFNAIPNPLDPIEIEEDQIYNADYYKFFPESNVGWQDFIFVPTETYNYVIETVGEYDVEIELYENYYNLINSDNNSGFYINENGNNNNSRIETTLVAGEYYRIRLKGIGNGSAGVAGYSGIIIRKSSNDLSFINKDLSLINSKQYYGYSIWQTFIPNTSMNYTIHTFAQSSSVDTYLEIYDNNYNKIAFDDDGGESLFSLINIYLQAGKRYYIRARNFNINNYSTFSISISRQQTILLDDGMLDYMKTEYFGIGKAVYFRYDANLQGALKISANISTSNYSSNSYDVDPYIKIYDDKMQLIKSNNDISTTDKNSYLELNIEIGQVYFIQISNCNDYQYGLIKTSISYSEVTAQPTILSSDVNSTSISWSYRNNDSTTSIMYYSLEYQSGIKWFPVTNGSTTLASGASTSVSFQNLTIGGTYRFTVYAKSNNKTVSNSVNDIRTAGIV